VTDLLTFGETMLRLSPADGERIETATELSFRTAGAESNVAVAAARLGVDAVWLSKLPDDPRGRRIRLGVDKHGVETDVSWTDGGRPGTYFVEPGGEPRGTNVVYDRADAVVRSATLDEFDAAGHLADARFAHVSGVTPALSDTLRETTRDLLAAARSRGVTTVFDLNYRSKLWSPDEAAAVYADLLDHVDLLVAARRDAETVLSVAGTAAEVAERLATTHGVDRVVVTDGAAGAAGYDGDHHPQDAFAAETVDPVGTGDAFVGGLLARLARGGSFPAALRYAAAVAALKRTVRGDHAVVAPAEVERVLDAGEAGISR
jgi:2-dehydro-3-deoxygluconokinase